MNLKASSVITLGMLFLCYQNVVLKYLCSMLIIFAGFKDRKSKQAKKKKNWYPRSETELTVEDVEDSVKVHMSFTADFQKTQHCSAVKH